MSSPDNHQRHIDGLRAVAVLSRVIFYGQGLFARIGVPGLGSFVNCAPGSTPDSGTNTSPDQWEYDVIVEYRVQSELLNGLWLRARAAFVDQDDEFAGAGDVNDIRFLINYDIPIL